MVEFKGNAPCIISGKARKEIKKKGEQRDEGEVKILVIHNSISCVIRRGGGAERCEPECSFTKAKG